MMLARSCNDADESPFIKMHFGRHDMLSLNKYLEPFLFA